MIDKLLNVLKEKYELTELSTREMAQLKANGMTFAVKAYKAKGLGHVSIMCAKGFGGLMKYVNGLLEKGGLSTDVFKKALGEEMTAKLFRNLLFGTSACDS